jgi:uncharacterized integral membrane protein
LKPRPARLFFAPRPGAANAAARAYNPTVAPSAPGDRMRIVGWILKLGFFLLVLWFALKNTTPVPVRLTANVTLDHVPLILVMLACLAVGALLGALALALPIYRMRREVSALRRQTPVMVAADAAGDRLAQAAREAGAVVDVAAGPR